MGGGAASGGASVVAVVGGADSTNAPRDTVRYATVTDTGTVGVWSNTTVLPAPRAFATAAIATPANSPVTGASYLYVLGGDSTASGKPVATVYVGTLGVTGAVTGWTTATPLPAAAHSLGVVIFNGSLYIAGGAGSGNAPLTTVDRAGIQSDGSLRTRKAGASPPFAPGHFGIGINSTDLHASR